MNRHCPTMTIFNTERHSSYTASPGARIYDDIQLETS